MKENVQKSYEENKGKSFKILIRLYKGNYLKLIFSTLLFIIKHTPAWILPIITATIIDTVSSPSESSIRTIYLCCVAMIVLIIQNIVSNYYHVKFQSIAIRSVEANLREALIRKLQQLSISYQKNLKSGKLQSKIMRDVEAVQTLSSQIFSGSLNITINIAVALIVTLYKSRIVFIFFMCTVPLAVIIIVAFRKKIKTRNSEFRHEMEETSAKVIEMINLVPIARAHALEEKEIARLDNQFKEVFSKGVRLDTLQSLFGSVGWAVFQIFQIICLGFTGILAYMGKITPGDVILYQTYFSAVVTSTSSLITFIPTIAKGMESVDSIGEILNAGDVEKNKGKKKVKDIQGEFIFDKVDYTYLNSKEKVIDNLNLKIDKGETIALVGASGSGKSTILNLVIGFIHPAKGKILLDGIDMKTLDLRSVRKHMAVVPQNTILFSGTIKENITYGLKKVSDDKLEEILEATNLKDVIDKLPEGLNTYIGEGGDTLSGGQKQRISIARAFIRNPRIIIMDEATSALDTISEKKIQESLQKLTEGRTTFIAAHRLSTIRNADRILVIDEGQCIESGSFDELIKLKGRFYEMHKLQI